MPEDAAAHAAASRSGRLTARRRRACSRRGAPAPAGAPAANSQNLRMELPEEFDVVGPAASRITGPPEGIESPFDDVPEPELLESGSGPDSDPSVEFRRTLGMFATGVTVITTLAGEQVHGMTANAFMSVSLKPPLILISVDRRAEDERPPARGHAVRGQRARGASDGALRPVRGAHRGRCAGAAASRSSARHRSSRARSRISSPGSCAPTGAATTRSSSVRSSTSATARARRCSSTAAATSASSAIRASSPSCRASCSTR